jgi:hypothetical protein
MERLQENLPPHEREEIERQLSDIDRASSFLNEVRLD